MTFYDDAELAAITVTRLAVDETEETPSFSGAIHAVVSDGIQVLDGGIGITNVTALVVALARHNAAALVALAGYRHESVNDVLDQFEQYKLAQIDAESGESR